MGFFNRIFRKREYDLSDVKTRREIFEYYTLIVAREKKRYDKKFIKFFDGIQIQPGQSETMAVATACISDKCPDDNSEEISLRITKSRYNLSQDEINKIKVEFKEKN